MVRRPTRLAEIYRKEKESGGGAFSAIGKRTVEKLDPRKFFNQSGILPLLLPSLFKAYRAIDNKKVEAEKYKTIRSIHSHLNVIRIDSKITAKNTMVLPAMARDMNMIRKGLLAAFKQIGIRSREAPDDYFTNAARRERQYEEQFKKENLNLEPKTAQPTAIKNEKGLLGSLFKDAGLATALTGIVLGGLFSGSAFASSSDWINEPKNQEKIGNFFSWILDTIKSGLSVLGDIGSVLLKEFEREDSEFRKSINSIVESILGFVKEHPIASLGIAFAAFGGLLPALTGALLLLNSDIIKTIGKLGILSASFGAGVWAGTKIREYGESFGAEEKQEQEHNARLKEIENINDPKLKQEITRKISEGTKSSSWIPESLESNKQNIQRHTELVFNQYKDKIEHDKSNKIAEQANAIAMPKGPTLAPTQPQTIPATTEMVPNLDGTEVIPKSPTKLSDTSNVDKVMKYLTSAEGLGLTKTQASGIIGNLQQESYADIRPTAENAGQYGIAQWSPDRQKDFERIMGKSMRGSSLEDQLAFMKWEMTQGNYKDTLQKLKSSTDSKQATEIFHNGFEKSGQKNISNRIAFAESIAQIPTTPTPITATENASNSNTTALNWKTGINQNIDANMKAKLQELQTIYGNKMVITAGAEKSGHVKNSQHYQGKAVDVRFNGTPEERADFIRKASALGFTGIGAYKDGLIHLDTRAQKMTWGDTYKRGSEPEWAKAALAEHMSGKIAPIETANSPQIVQEKNPEIEQQLTKSISYGESVNTQQNLIDKFRATDRRLLNQPRIDGTKINNVSSEWLDAIKKASPPIVNVVNTPAPPKAPPTTPTDAKPQYNDGVIDREFIKLLVGRTVDNFTVAV